MFGFLRHLWGRKPPLAEKGYAVVLTLRDHQVLSTLLLTCQQQQLLSKQDQQAAACMARRLGQALDAWDQAA